MRGLKGEKGGKGGVVADLKVEQNRNKTGRTVNI